ncbi:MAG: endolytic transglycosylase MltG [Alphaproteobacteria bacterium]|nr:endolytic transglycosylase MltG [Alphaproteobacteria bacterium]
MSQAKTSPRRKKKQRRRPSAFLQVLNGLLMLLVLGIGAVVALAYYGFDQFYRASETTADSVFEVERDSGLRVIANKLAAAGLISNSFVFRFAVTAQSRDVSIKAGEFRIAARASMADILEEITEGRAIQYTVTIPEGFTSWQVVERLKTAANLTGELEGVPAEGTLLPDTYSFARDATRQSVLDVMLTAQAASLAEIWAGRDPDLPIQTPQELVILASIVEKETGVAAERPKVAGVFINRLRRNMRLQSDPTIIYGITGGEGTLGRGLRRSEIDAETPYNTYQINGLPVGPIANPGIDALKAVANPEVTEALYFVADGTGGHAFANTYAEHRRNVAAWRKIEAAREAEKKDRLDAEAEAEAQAARDDLQAEAEAAAGSGG